MLTSWAESGHIYSVNEHTFLYGSFISVKTKAVDSETKIQPEFFFCINGLNKKVTRTFSRNKRNSFFIEHYKLSTKKTKVTA